MVKSAVISSSQPVNAAPAAIFTSNSSPSSSVSSQSSPNHVKASNITPGQPPPLHTLGRPGLSRLVSTLIRLEVVPFVASYMVS